MKFAIYLMVFFSRNNLPRIKDIAYVINLEDKNSKETHWVSLFINKNVAVSFDSFGIEYISLEVLSKIRHKSITPNISTIQDNESIMYRFYCIAFIEYTYRKKVVKLY